MKYYNILKLAAWSDIDPTSQAWHQHKILPKGFLNKDSYNIDHTIMPNSGVASQIIRGNDAQSILNDFIKDTRMQEYTGPKTRFTVEQYMNNPELHFSNHPHRTHENFNPNNLSVDEANSLKKQVAETQLNLLNSKEFQNQVKADRLGRSMAWIMSSPLKNTDPKLHSLMNSMSFTNGGFSYDPTNHTIYMGNTIDPYALTHEFGHVDAIHKARTDPKYYKDIEAVGKEQNILELLGSPYSKKLQFAKGMLRMEAEANSHSNNLLRQSLQNNPKLLNQLMFGRSLTLPAAYSTYLSGSLPFIGTPSMPSSIIGKIPWGGLCAAEMLSGAAGEAAGHGLLNASTFIARKIHPNLPDDIIAHAQSIGMPEYWSSENKINELRKSLQAPLRKEEIITQKPVNTQQAPLRKEEISTKGPVNTQPVTNKFSPMSRRLLKGSLNKR